MRTVMREGRGEYEEKRSVFYGACLPVSTEKEATDFITAEKRRYPDARHHAYAYLIREGNITRYSDDREPQGTAGMPILDLLRKSGMENLVVVVTRYFGGTLLGTGGLVRAYTAAAKAAVEAATPAHTEGVVCFTLLVSYGEYDKMTSLLSGVKVEDAVFGEEVALRLAISEGDYPRFLTELTQKFGGRLVPTDVFTAETTVPDEVAR